MCMFLCANPIVHSWLEIPAARAHRKSLQLQALCTNPYFDFGESSEESRNNAEPALNVSRTLASEGDEVELEIYIVVTTSSADEHDGGLPQDWHHALDAIAQAWGRLIAFVRSWC